MHAAAIVTGFVKSVTNGAERSSLIRVPKLGWHADAGEAMIAETACLLATVHARPTQSRTVSKGHRLDVSDLASYAGVCGVDPTADRLPAGRGGASLGTCLDALLASPPSGCDGQIGHFATQRGSHGEQLQPPLQHLSHSGLGAELALPLSASSTCAVETWTRRQLPDKSAVQEH